MNCQRMLAVALFTTLITNAVLLCSPAIAQTHPDVTDKAQLTPLSPPQFFRFVLMMGAVQKASHQNKEGDYAIHGSIQPGWEGGADYLHNISGTFFYGLGVHLAVTGHSTILNTPALASNPSAHYERNPAEKDRQFDPVLAIPAFVEKQWQLTSRKGLYAHAGVQLNLAVSGEYFGFGSSLADSSGNYVEVYSQTTRSYQDGKPWLSYKVGGGMQWALRSENLLGIGLVATLCSTDFVSGTYQVTVPGKPDTKGIIKASGSYIGVNVSYGLAGRFRRKVKNGER